MKRLWIPLFVAALAVAGWLWFRRANGGLRVQVAAAAVGPIAEFIEERGKTRLPETYLVTMPYDGRVEAIDLLENTPVREGQVVARVKPFDTGVAVAEARSVVERLEASIRRNDDRSIEDTAHKQTLQFVVSMANAVQAAAERVRAGAEKFNFSRSHEKRVRQLFEEKKVTQEQYDQAQLELVTADVDLQQDKLVHLATQAMDVATRLTPIMVQQYIERKVLDRAVLEKERAEAAARLERMEEHQRRGEMTSPVDGVVLERAVSNERHLPAGTLLVRIGQLDRLEVEADVLSQDAVEVEPGDRVELYGPAIGRTPVAGLVERVYPAGFTKVSSLGVEQQRVKVVIRFAPGVLAALQAQRRLGVDYRVSVRIFTTEKPAALAIPRSALFRGAAGNWHVFAVRDGAARLTEVQVGLLNDQQVEIAGGLGQGDQVILAPDTSLVDGARVTPLAPQTVHAADE